MKKYESLEAIPSEDGHKHKFIQVNGRHIFGAPFYECEVPNCSFKVYHCFHGDKYIPGEPEKKSSIVNGQRLYCKSCHKEIGTHGIDEDDFNRNTD